MVARPNTNQRSAERAFVNRESKLSRFRAGRWWVTVAGLSAAWGFATPAFAFHTEVDARSEAQFYSVKSPYGQPVLQRQRFTQTLGLSVYDLQPRQRPEDPQLFARFLLRMNGDFGQQAAERDPSRLDRYIPGLEQAPLNLMYGYIEGRGYLGGAVGFKLGRQYLIDALGWWSFDGALARVVTPAYFQIELYGGAEQRGGLPWLSSSRFESQGVYRGDRTGLEELEWPSLLKSERLAPAYGIALETHGLHVLHSKLSYRKVLNRDSVLLSPFADRYGNYQVIENTRISSEKVGWAARFTPAPWGSAGAEAVYDLYHQSVSELLGALDAHISPSFGVGLDYDYYLPTFDGDSIWNWFAHYGQTSLRLRAAARIEERWQFAAATGARFYDTLWGEALKPALGEGAESQNAAMLRDHFVDASVGYAWPTGYARLNGELEAGERGHRYGSILSLKNFFEQKRYDAGLIMSLYDWRDELKPELSATSVGYVVSFGHQLLSENRVGLEWEHDINRLVGQRYRVLATLDLTLLD